MKVTMTKAQVVEALRKEPLRRLRASAFFDVTRNESEPIDGCTRCAVGAVLAYAIDERTPTSVAGNLGWRNTSGSPLGGASSKATALREGNYLGALSMHFESLVDDMHGTKRVTGKVRESCVRFVQRNFPATITVDIGEAKPRTRTS